MIDFLNQRMSRKIFDDFFGVFDMSVESQRQRFRALKQQESVERRNCSSGVAKQNRANISYKCGFSCSLRERYAVIAGVWSCYVRIFFRRPLEVAAFYDYSAQSRSVSADELCCGMNDDIGSVLNRANKVGSSESIVNYDRNAVRMRNFRNSVNIWNIAVRIA